LSNVVHTYKEHLPDILDGTAGVREITLAQLSAGFDEEPSKPAFSHSETLDFTGFYISDLKCSALIKYK
jgi:hypothetical protein